MLNFIDGNRIKRNLIFFEIFMVFFFKLFATVTPV